MKLAIITDTHWGARNDSQAFAEYFRRFYEDIFFPTLMERDIRTVVHMGDIVDRRKFINYKTLYQMREIFFDTCWDQYISIHAIIGNHDTFFKNTNQVNSMDCLRMMMNGDEGDGGGMVRIYHDPTEVVLMVQRYFFNLGYVQRTNNSLWMQLPRQMHKFFLAILRYKDLKCILVLSIMKDYHQKFLKSLNMNSVVTFTTSLIMVMCTILVIHSK